MVQIGLLVVAAGILFGGIQALRGKESSEKETPKAVAIAMIVVAALLAIFALFVLPVLFAI